MIIWIFTVFKRCYRILKKLSTQQLLIRLNSELPIQFFSEIFLKSFPVTPKGGNLLYNQLNTISQISDSKNFISVNFCCCVLTEVFTPASPVPSEPALEPH